MSTSGYALTSDGIVLNTGGAEWVLDNVIGRARLEATPVAAGCTTSWPGPAVPSSSTGTLRRQAWAARWCRCTA